MGSQENLLAVAGLRFFGQMSASISHEIKNVLAIINENAGLMEDLAMMGEKGMPVSPERLTRIAGSVAGQVRRADGIIKNWNRFAHSIDRMNEEVDLPETIRFVSALATRLVFMKNITIEIVPPHHQITFNGSLYFIENIIWKCIEAAISMPLQNDTLVITPEKPDEKPIVSFSAFEGDSNELLPTLTSQMNRELLSQVKADIEIGDKGNAFALVFK